eukprot:m.150825 g.150825  ORF g.150825 m.150825 type:complete len:158 (+) comp17392_c0_seq5:524-997(+)
MTAELLDSSKRSHGCVTERPDAVDPSFEQHAMRVINTTMTSAVRVAGPQQILQHVGRASNGSAPAWVAPSGDGDDDDDDDDVDDGGDDSRDQEGSFPRGSLSSSLSGSARQRFRKAQIGNVHRNLQAQQGVSKKHRAAPTKTKVNQDDDGESTPDEL